MSGGVILENLSGRKLFVLVFLLLICQLACFLIGGLIAPTPSATDMVLASKCLKMSNDSNQWFYIRGQGKCDTFDLEHYSLDGFKTNPMAENIVFTFQIPTPRDGVILDYSRWQQNLIGVLYFDIVYHPGTEMDRNIELTLETRLGYANQGDKDGDWKEYAMSIEKRNLDCIAEEKIEDHNYQCSIVPLFELGSLHHDYYLINIRIPVNEQKKLNVGLGHLKDLWLVVINQNGGFTRVWLTMKTIFFPFIVAIMIWFWNRVHMLTRKPVLLERMLMTIGYALTLLNFPIEFLTLYYDMPFMLLLQDIRQGVFYAALLSFWLIFAGEHLMIQDPQHKHLRSYWKHLSAVAVGCISLFVFDLCERGAQLKNPFYSIWVTKTGTNLALTFIILAAISGGLYFIFLCYMIWKVFCNISAKRTALPSMSNARRLHYEGSIYRFKFLMIATLLCAALTVIGFIMGQASEGRWKWNESTELEYTSAFFTGVYGMWNIYIFALIVLYSPSHKHWPSEIDVNNSSSDTIEFSRLPTEPTEMSSLASFSRKSALD
ncbi:protein wntless [Daktulosphaira vitifoliae]|uniref:protein wntless n=1 Tax=Daktulosphaira vitifoliae TaxID=58002 RepID=UPI0021A9DE5E|nr:protein wntless [Daktulosphaira vitifoliae]